MVWVVSITEPDARVGVIVTHFGTFVTASAAPVPLLAPAEVDCSTVNLRKRFPGAVNKMLF